MSTQNRLWILMGKKLSDSVTPDEERELDALFQQYPDVWYTYEVLNSIDDKDKVPEEFMEQVRSLLQLDPPVAIAEPESEVAVARVRPVWLKLASAAVFLFVLSWAAIWGYGYLHQTGKTANNVVSVAVLNGAKTDLILPDGSHVALNAGSKLTYPKNYAAQKVREVYLSGEAYFKVLHDPKHPFIIHTEHFDIRDIGTTFNVKAYPGEKVTEASLIEGAIEISLKDAGTDKILLKPRQKVVLMNDGDPAVQTAQTETYKVVALDINKQSSNYFAETSWVNNELVFKNEAFEDLAKQMERKYNVGIAFGDDKIKSVPLTGVFKQETVEQALKELQMFTTFKYIMNKDSILIQSR